MCTGGAYRPFLQDRHFSDASSFQIGVSRGRRIASSGRLARVAATAFDFKPAETAVEALANRRRRLCRPAVPLHSDRPGLGLRAIGLADRLFGAFACAFSADLGTA